MSGERAKPGELIVLSGKGGTGKTSVVASFAALAPSKVLADCDVDAADLHLVLDPSGRSQESFTSGKEAHISPERCSSCGLCLERCRFDAIRVDDGSAGRAVYAVDPTSCEGCGMCVHVCTSNAVDLSDAERGRLFVADTRNGPLVFASLNIGGENSGKLVTLVRERALALAGQSGARFVLADGPPGIGCPVIASVTGADLALVVTEPTVSGVHDLQRVVALIKGFGIRPVVCINKADLNQEMTTRLREYCRAEEVPIVGELSYDIAVVKAQVAGKSVVEYGESPVADQIRAMWEIVEMMLIKEDY